MKTIARNELTPIDPIALTLHDHAAVSLHQHAFFELVYVCRGKAEHIFDHKTSIVSEGDFFLVDLNVAHEYRPIGNQEGLQVINCLFLPEALDPSLNNAESFQDILDRLLPRYGYRPFEENPTRRIFHDESGLVRDLMSHMLREYQEKRTGFGDILRNLLLTLTLHLTRCAFPEEGRSATGIVRDIRDYVSLHYTSPLSLSEICQTLHFSLPYVSSVFHRETGMTFRSYLSRIRIEKACHLLRKSDLNISEIAERIGYTDPAFFYKSFRREMELTPDEYRRKYRI